MVWTKNVLPVLVKLSAYFDTIGKKAEINMSFAHQRLMMPTSLNARGKATGIISSGNKTRKTTLNTTRPYPVWIHLRSFITIER